MYKKQQVFKAKVDNFYDLGNPTIQHNLLSDFLSQQPFFTMLSPPCTHLCQYMFSNWGRMDPMTKYELLHKAIGHIDVSCWIAEVQSKSKSYYCIENPEGSQAWNRENAPCQKTYIFDFFATNEGTEGSLLVQV